MLGFPIITLLLLRLLGFQLLGIYYKRTGTAPACCEVRTLRAEPIAGLENNFRGLNEGFRVWGLGFRVRGLVVLGSRLWFASGSSKGFVGSFTGLLQGSNRGGLNYYAITTMRSPKESYHQLFKSRYQILNPNP